VLGDALKLATDGIAFTTIVTEVWTANPASSVAVPSIVNVPLLVGVNVAVGTEPRFQAAGAPAYE
jgi:hypothetical protein